MPPLISRCLCLNLESEIIPSSDRFQDQSQHIDLLMQHFLQDVMLFGLISDVYIDSETAQPVGVHFNIFCLLEVSENAHNS